ncbi:hypothetical protein STEG23_004918, partial [Scotinomys teguina]
MSELPLNGGLEMLFHVAVKLKPGLLWRPRDIGDALGHLTREAANREWNQPQRKKYVDINKVEQRWRYDEYFDIRHGDAEFEVSPSNFQSSFGAAIPHYAPFSAVWNGNVYPVLLYVG